MIPPLPKLLCASLCVLNISCTPAQEASRTSVTGAAHTAAFDAPRIAAVRSATASVTVPSGERFDPTSLIKAYYDAGGPASESGRGTETPPDGRTEFASASASAASAAMAGASAVSMVPARHAGPAAAPARLDASAQCTIAGRGYTYGPDVVLPRLHSASRIFKARSDGPLEVRFYWMPGSGHVSIGFEYNPRDLTAERDPPLDYSCTAQINGKSYSQQVKMHHQFQRWRFQNFAAPVVADVQDLVRRWVLLPNDAAPQAERAMVMQEGSGLKWADPFQPGLRSGLCEPLLGRNAYDRPLAAAGFQRYLGAPGTRQEIGPYPEAAALWVAALRSDKDLIGSEACVAEVTARNQSEVSGSMPINARDPRTGWSVAYEGPYAASWFGRTYGSKDILWNTPTGTKDPENGWTLDTAHMSSPAYVQAVLTYDPYLIESVMFLASYVIGNRNFEWRGRDKGLVLATGEPRDRAWSLMRIIQALHVTPRGPFRDYLLRVIEHNRQFMNARPGELNYYNDLGVLLIVPVERKAVAAGKAVSVDAGGRTIPVEKGANVWSMAAPPWMEDWITQSFAWAHLSGFGDWSAILRHRLDKQIGPRLRAHNGQGYNYAEASAYQAIFSADFVTSRRPERLPTFRTWREVKDATAFSLGWGEQVPLGRQGERFMFYNSYLRNALRMTAWAGLDQSKPYLDYMDSEVARLRQAKGTIVSQTNLNYALPGTPD